MAVFSTSQTNKIYKIGKFGNATSGEQQLTLGAVCYALERVLNFSYILEKKERSVLAPQCLHTYSWGKTYFHHLRYRNGEYKCSCGISVDRKRAEKLLNLYMSSEFVDTNNVVEIVSMSSFLGL